MKRNAIRVSIVLLPALAAFAQQRTFEVASVKPVPGLIGEKMEGESISVTETGLTLRSITLRSALQWAYNVKPYQIEGPGWMGSERYLIAAKASGPASAAELRVMLQGLIADRFHVALHRDTRVMPVYALVPAKGGPKLQPAKGEEKQARPGLGGFAFRSFSMADLAERLGARPFRVDRPIVDRTGLTGTFDFDIKLGGGSPDPITVKRAFEALDNGGDDSPTTFALLQDQLGLRLQPEKSPVEILVIDRADKVPTEN